MNAQKSPFKKCNYRKCPQDSSISYCPTLCRWETRGYGKFVPGLWILVYCAPINTQGPGSHYSAFQYFIGILWVKYDVFILAVQFSSVQFSRSVVSDSATPWTAARQASLSISTQRLLRFMSTELVMLSNQLILCRPLLLP